MGGVSLRGGSQEVIKLITIVRLKMEDVCPLTFSSSKWHWCNHVKTYRHVYVNNQIPQLLKEGIDQWGVNCDSSFP
jgi:hypothetical protein